MIFRKLATKRRMDFSTLVEKEQIGLINDNRVYSIVTMSLGAVLLHFFLTSQIENSIFTRWLAAILAVDVFRLYATWSYSRSVRNNQEDYRLARLHLFIGTVLSGFCWGGLGVISIYTLNGQDILIVIAMLVAVSTASTTTLSYQYHFSVIFILLVLTPLIIFLPEQRYIVDSHLTFVELVIVVLIIFSLKNARVFNVRSTHMLQLQLDSREHERELEAQRMKAEKANRAKSQFLANMSHELRTPMHAILGFSSLGASKIGTVTDEKISGYFSRINKSGQHLLAMLNDLLDLSKLEAGRMVFKFSENDLWITIDQVVKELTPLIYARSLTIDIEPVQFKMSMIYDNEKIAQVVRNLLSNAIKFTPDGMKVMIYFEEAKLYSNKDHVEKDAISVSIQDQGAGIPEDELELVFDEFVQSSKTESGTRGTGLGLSISREIIARHGGVIKACNSIGDGGAIFTFTLPCKPAMDAD